MAAPSPLNPVEFLRHKRDGGEHRPSDIAAFIDAFVAGNVADYQASAWLMAAFLKGLSSKETLALTRAMLHSGDVLTLPSVKRARVDKHSTGGVGDKISLCLAPLVAACGVAVPMISGRGLGHTGGTLDKLEAIPGFRVDLDAKRFERIVREVGTCLIGQTEKLAPADRRLYALRDVTATVECIPLIVASILSKKLAEGIDGLVLDVKCGGGAFMKDLKSARALAQALVSVGKGAGKRVSAIITDMSAPIGRTIGNALETREAIEILQNAGPADTRALTLELGAEMLVVGRRCKSRQEALPLLERALADGSALDVFRRLVKAQGGDVRVVDDPSRLPRSKVQRVVTAAKSGYVTAIDAYALGVLAIELGAGRTRADQKIEPAAGFELHASVGERVERGAMLVTIHAASRAKAKQVAARVAQAFALSSRAPRQRRLVLERSR
ncbi:MAG TPA: thymidine phosphorylase [Polyangiaceae bacterium]|nr:thymidine phosphorylase [Polyangiaceae bacterium]